MQRLLVDRRAAFRQRDTQPASATAGGRAHAASTDDESPTGALAFAVRWAAGGAVLMIALVVGSLTIPLGVAPAGWQRLALRWIADATLADRLRTGSADEAEAVAQALYGRLRAGTLNAAALLDAAREMWSVVTYVEPRMPAGGESLIVLQLRPPNVIDDEFADGQPGPEVQWRLGRVTLDDGTALAVADAVTTRTPLTKFSPTIVCRATLPESTPLGPTRVHVAVELAVRASSDGPIVGRWTTFSRHDAEVVDAATLVAGQ